MFYKVHPSGSFPQVKQSAKIPFRDCRGRAVFLTAFENGNSIPRTQAIFKTVAETKTKTPPPKKKEEDISS